MDPQLYGQLIFDKAGKNMQWKKDSFFNKWCWENWTAMCGRVKLNHSLTPYKDKLKMDERPKCEEGLHHNPRGAHRQKPLRHQPQQLLSRYVSKGEGNKCKMNFWDFNKIKHFCTAKERVNKTKRQPTEWEKIFIIDITDKGLISKICEELLKLNIQEKQIMK